MKLDGEPLDKASSSRWWEFLKKFTNIYLILNQIIIYYSIKNYNRIENDELISKYSLQNNGLRAAKSSLKQLYINRKFETALKWL